MNETRTSSMLQRLPIILAVTAASYGLQVPAYTARTGSATASKARATLPVDTRAVTTQAGKHRG
jgi:hypothetical protein